MSDPDFRPPTYDELKAENDVLRSTIAALQNTLATKDSEIAAIRKPRPGRVLDKNADSPFDRPAFSK